MTLKFGLRMGWSVKSTVTEFAPFVMVVVNDAGGAWAFAEWKAAMRASSIHNTCTWKDRRTRSKRMRFDLLPIINGIWFIRVATDWESPGSRISPHRHGYDDGPPSIHRLVAGQSRHHCPFARTAWPDARPPRAPQPGAAAISKRSRTASSGSPRAGRSSVSPLCSAHRFFQLSARPEYCRVICSLSASDSLWRSASVCSASGPAAYRTWPVPSVAAVKITSAIDSGVE
jgi:hypothetical protein